MIVLLLIVSVQCDSFDNQKPKELFDPYDHPLLVEGDTLVFENIADTDSFYVSESEVYAPHKNPGKSEANYTEFWVPLMK